MDTFGKNPRALIVDLLMATMDSMSVWEQAARDRTAGLAWRDAVSRRMREAGAYVPYERLVAEEAAVLRLPDEVSDRLEQAWVEMAPWPDTAALADLDAPFGFLTNCSARLAELAAARSALRPLFVLSAEEAGWYKPDRRAYHAACKRLGVEPPDALLVAGSGYDAVGAHAAGLPSVLIRRRYEMDLADDWPLFESLTHLMAALQPGNQAGQRR